MITLSVRSVNAEKSHINARLINSKCHRVLWITYYRNVRKRLRVWQRLISLAYFEEPSSAVFLPFLKHSLHLNILKEYFRVVFFPPFFCQLYLHVFMQRAITKGMIWGRLATPVILLWLCETATEGKSWSGCVKVCLSTTKLCSFYPDRKCANNLGCGVLQRLMWYYLCPIHLSPTLYINSVAGTCWSLSPAYMGKPVSMHWTDRQ